MTDNATTSSDDNQAVTTAACSQPPQSSSIILTFVISCLVVAAALALAFYYNQQQQHSHQANLQSLTTYTTQLEQEVKQLRAKLTSATQDWQSASEELRSAIEHANAPQNISPRYVLRESLYLVDIAQHNLTLMHNPDLAISALTHADQILKQSQVSNVHHLRQQILTDLTKLKAIQPIDKALYLSDLDWITQQLSTLQIKTPKVQAQNTPAQQTKPDKQATWKDKLKNNLSGLNKLIIVTHSDERITPLISNAQREAAQAYVRTQLAQASFALVHDDEILLKRSIHNASRWSLQTYDLSTPTGKLITDKLGKLEALNLTPTYPSLSGLAQSLQGALKELS